MRIEAGTRAVVTGASKGIGRATARALADRGARLGLIARGAEELQSLAAELEGEAVALPADVGDAEAIDRAVAEFAGHAGGIDLLIANAGVAHYGPFIDVEAARAEELVRVNFVGTLNTIRAALEAMLRAGRGHIVVVSSASALRTFPWAAVYGATKAAQQGFAAALRHELSGTGVSVTTVYPGEVQTSLHAHERERMPDWYRSSDAIHPDLVAAAIVEAVERDRREVHIPRQVRLLGLNALFPGPVDRLLALLRGGSAAPRRY